MRRHGCIAFLAMALLAAAAYGEGWRESLPAKENVASYLQEISVTIKSGSSEGSGVIKTREIEGKKTNLIWTAAHVVDDLRSVKKIIDPATGTERQVVEFRDCHIVKELNETGRRVGELKMDAAIVRYSSEEDLALLRVRKSDFVQASVVFHLDDAIPPIGTPLFHVGSLLGQTGSNSMTSGIISQIGRTLNKDVYDQTTVTAFPGSSGGGVYTQDGAYVGMVVRGAGEGFNLIVPVRRMCKWAKAANVLWAIDDTVATPTEAELKALSVEDTGVQFERDESADHGFRYMIRAINGN